MSERELQKAVLELARRLGWREAHFTTARTNNGGYLTPQQGHPGFPDLVLCRPPRLVFAELKVGKNHLSGDQALWLNGLKACTGTEAYEWREQDWFTGVIESVLS